MSIVSDDIKQLLSWKSPLIARMWPITLFVVCLGLAIGALNPYAYSKVNVSITLSSAQPGSLHTYWASAGEDFSSSRHVYTQLTAGEQVVNLALPPLPRRKILLRLDPDIGTGSVTLRQINISRMGFTDRHMRFPDDRGSLYPHQVTEQEVSSEGLRLSYTGKHPQLVVRTRLDPAFTGVLLTSSLIITAAIALWLLCWAGACVDGKARMAIFVVIASAISIVLGMSEAPFSKVLVKDAYTYIEKAFEITEGNWSLRPRKAIGWSALQALFISALEIKSYFEAMSLSRLLGIALTALGTIPLFLLGRQVAGPVAGTVAAVYFITHPRFIYSSYIGFAEPLYMLVQYFALFLIVKSAGQGRLLWAGVAMASIAFFVRPQGLFMIPFFILFFLLVEVSWANRLKLIAGAVAVFIAISLPHLIPRTVQFGSPMDYGDNSKYLVDSYRYVYAPNIKSPTIFEFMQEKGIVGLYEKFFVNGFVALTKHFTYALGLPWMILAVVTSVAAFFVSGLKKVRPLVLYCCVFFFLLVPVWDVYQSARFYYSIIPASIIIGTAGVLYVLGALRMKALSLVVAAAFVLFSVVSSGQRANLFFYERIRTPSPPPDWAQWAGKNLYGSTAMIDNLNMVEMSAGERSRNVERRKSLGEKAWIATFRPGVYANLEDALQNWRRKSVRFVISDSAQNRRLPYFFDIENRVGQDFDLIREFHYSHTDGSGRKQVVRFYKIIYDTR